MKTRKNIFSVMAALLGAILFLSSGIRSFATDESAVIISIRLKPTNPPTAPRTIPAQISAEYDDVLNSVVASLVNAGTSVAVSIENLSTGESYNDAVSGNGIAVLPISGTPGTWIITFTLSGGEVYVGEFNL